jgi:DNA-binding NtrC family response regulator
VIQIEDVLPALNLDRIDRTPARVVPVGNLRDARLRFERDYISSVLQHHGWRMAEAAHALGIQRPNLYRKARQLGIPVTRSSE